MARDTTKPYGPGHPEWEQNQRVLRGEVRPEDVAKESAGPGMSEPQIPALASTPDAREADKGKN